MLTIFWELQNRILHFPDSEICRVCRCGETPEHPLFHPCKCSGSIRHVHQDCLTEWLSHSRKKYCELCEHPFSFTPVYRPDMPSNLPFLMLAGQMYRKTISTICTIIRAVLVTCNWMIFIPYLTSWNWRFIFWCGDYLAAQLSSQQNASTPVDVMSLQTNAQEYQSIYQFFGVINTSTFWSDCLHGQIIACAAVVIVIATFFLREWLVQNISNEIEHEELDEQNEILEEGLIIEDSDNEGIEGTAQTDLQHHIAQPLGAEEDWQGPGRNRAGVHLPANEDVTQQQLDDDERDGAPPFVRGQPPNAPFIRPLDHPLDNVHEHEQQRRGVLVEEPMDEDMEVIQNHANPVAPQIPAVDNNDNNNIENNPEDNNVQDDINGILEVLGMRGHLWVLAQNSFLVMLLISLCLFAAIWLPYILGVVFILVTPVKLIFNLLESIRKATDLVFDGLVQMSIINIWSFIKELHISYMSDPSIEHRDRNDQDCITDIISSRSWHSFNRIYEAAMTWKIIGSLQQRVFDIYCSASHVIHQVQPTVKYLSSNFSRLAARQTAFSRFICILVGYAILILLGSWYYRHLSTHNSRFGRSVRPILRQQGIILKVGMFIAIELLIFPIACGILLDVSSLPLFPGATVRTRAAHLQMHPFASVFIHWFLGTGFMFIFAAVITTYRECVRPGVLWFIRDPNDPQFHPIKEIVERSTLSQLQNLGSSCILYAFIIVCGVGGTIRCLQMPNLDILPLRWNLRHPPSAIPFDFLVVHIVVPYALKYLKIKNMAKVIMVRWQKFLCRKLRLSSYMFGGRYDNEEGVYSHGRFWEALFTPNKATFQRNGQLVFAPKVDNIPYIPGRRMLVPADPETMQILDPVERELGHPASIEPNDMSRIELVYLPPSFKQRIALFILMLWSFSVLLLSLTLALPIVIGRWIYHSFLHVATEIHDVYSYFAGGLVLYAAWLTITATANLCHDLIQTKDIGNWLTHVRLRVYQAIVLTCRLIYMGAALGILLPILLGSVAEMYLVLPMQDFGTESPSIDVALIWVRGFLCMTIIHGIINVIPRNRWQRHVNLITEANIHAVDIYAVTMRLVLPIVSAGLIALLIPLVFAAILSNLQLTGTGDPSYRIRMIQSIYPCVLVVLACVQLCRLGTKVVCRWIQTIRDDNYLAGMILHNFEH
ncbi:hypothetical protein BX666DRAFT_2009796 [Dichotomocladium elegans]|nr:hypothetical protein BX666DRAFT_2009796 [Dichotomocladium elegans]